MCVNPHGFNFDYEITNFFYREKSLINVTHGIYYNVEISTFELEGNNFHFNGVLGFWGFGVMNEGGLGGDG